MLMRKRLSDGLIGVLVASPGPWHRLFSAGFAFSIVVGGTSLRWRRRAGTNDALPAFCGSGGITDSPRLPPSGAPPSCPVRGGTSFCEAPQSALGGPEREKLSQRFLGKWAGRLATPSLSPRSTASAFCWRGFRFLRKRTGDCEFFFHPRPQGGLAARVSTSPIFPLRRLARHLSARAERSGFFRNADVAPLCWETRGCPKR
jgi:hypothetical protein